MHFITFDIGYISSEMFTYDSTNKLYPRQIHKIDEQTLFSGIVFWLRIENRNIDVVFFLIVKFFQEIQKIWKISLFTFAFLTGLLNCNWQKLNYTLKLKNLIIFKLMANNHIKRCSTKLIIGEMKIKTVLRYY